MADKSLVKQDKRFHESFLRKTTNSILVGVLIGISYLPFWVLFGISDILFFFINYIVKYRKDIITDNLRHAFPEKTELEIKAITKKYYQHFCDVFVETVKAYSISEKQFNKRIKFHQVEKFKEYFDQGRSLIFFGMHYNNWEWSSFSARFGKHDVMFVYNPLRGNEAFERFMNHIRGRWGATTVPVHRSSRVVLTFGKTEKPAAIWLGADQTPPPSSKFWTLFLHREAPFFSGPEKIAHYSNQPVFLHVTRKIKRGKYEVEFIPLFDKPKEEVSDSNEILLAYVRKMEEIIRERPEYYLWSHRRWKHTRPEGIELTL